MRAPTRLEQRCAAARSRLNERRRRLVHAMLESSEESVFLSSRELARRYNVDPATIVRTVQALGYRRFADFSSDLRAHFVMRLTPYSLNVRAGDRPTPSSRVPGAIEQDLQNIHRLVEEVDPERVLDLAREIRSARRVVVVGIDAAYSLAAYFSFKLGMLGVAADAPIGSEGNLLYQVRLLTAKDLLIAISFGRCLKQAVLAVQRAHQRDVRTFGITDSNLTPIAEFCDRHLVVAVRNEWASGSFAAPMALVSAVLAGFVGLDPGHAIPVPYEGEPPYLSHRWYAPVGAVSTGSGRSPDHRAPR
jgi:DNA-binding MurR/RpiR family transcriptional regulator